MAESERDVTRAALDKAAHGGELSEREMEALSLLAPYSDELVEVARGYQAIGKVGGTIRWVAQVVGAAVILWNAMGWGAPWGK